MRPRAFIVATLFLALPLFAAPDAPKFRSRGVSAGTAARYLVSVRLDPGDDLPAVAAQLVATYGARLETANDTNTFIITAGEANARLLSDDRRIAFVQETDPAQPAAVVSPVPGFGTYTYDGAGNITAVGDHTFSYDELGRIQKATLGAGRSAEYSYDRYGNIVTIVTDGDTTNAARPAVDPLTNRINASGASYNMLGTYDRSGNMTSYNGATTFVYDALDTITESNVDGARRLYLYSATNERIATVRMAGSTPVAWEWTIRDAGGTVLRRFSKDSSNTWRWDEDYVYRGGQLLAAEKPGDTLHFHLDHLGTPRAISGRNGTPIAQHTYYPFGRELTDAGQDAESRKFTGHERDASNLDYMHARSYLPYTGRFLSVDPGIDFKTNLRNPQGWNRYSYVRNNPMRWTDPTGKVVEYDESFRKRVKEDAVFRAAFEAWKKTPSGQKQWQTMARDKDTKYTFSVAKVVYQPSLLSDKFAVNGMTVPPSYAARENKYGQLNHPAPKSTINADRMEEGGTARTQARTIAGALFEEAAHAIDLGGSGRTEWGANKAEEGFHADPPTEPRWIRYMRELLTVLPPED